MSGGALVELGLDGIGDHFGRYRLHMPVSEKAMARSLRRYGQVSPVVVCLRRGRYELIDGFKRLGGGAQHGGPGLASGVGDGGR